MTDLMLIVAARTQVAEGICSFELESWSGADLPPFTPGAHIDVHVRPGIVRQYSLCGEPANRRRWRIAVQREPASRGGSAGMHEDMRPGTALHASAPRNHFELVPSAHSLLIAGGIGVTPILAMAQSLHRDGRGFAMHYCTRSPGRTAFRDEIAAAPFAGHVHFHFDDGEAPQRFDAERALSTAHGEAHLYVCGPSGFMDHVLGAARRLGWPESRLHREYFAGATALAAMGGSFEVRLARAGKTLKVAADQTVLQVLLAEGVDIPFSCESGVCGTCLTRVLEGDPEHRDMYLTDAERAENRQFTPCCSRSRSACLVLDI